MNATQGGSCSVKILVCSSMINNWCYWKCPNILHLKPSVILPFYREFTHPEAQEEQDVNGQNSDSNAKFFSCVLLLTDIETCSPYRGRAPVV